MFSITRLLDVVISINNLGLGYGHLKLFLIERGLYTHSWMLRFGSSIYKDIYNYFLFLFIYWKYLQLFLIHNKLVMIDTFLVVFTYLLRKRWDTSLNAKVFDGLTNLSTFFRRKYPLEHSNSTQIIYLFKQKHISIYGKCLCIYIC